MAILVPQQEDIAKEAFLVDPTKADDGKARAAARILAQEALKAQTIAEMPDESFKTEEEKAGAASKIVELMTGEKDYDGRLWNGGKGFRTGAEYLSSVKEVISRGTQAAMDPDLQAWVRMTDEEKDAKLAAEQGVLSSIGEGMGDAAAGIGEIVRGVPRLSKEEYANAPEDVRKASDWMGSVMFAEMPKNERKACEAKISEWRGSDWQKLKRRSEYEAKLRRKNALVYLPDMIRTLRTDDAKDLAGELAQNPDEIPANWTARLKQLPTRDIETLAQIRGMTRKHVEGGLFNWIGDTAIGVYNAGRNLLAGMGQQEAKVAAMAMGWDGEQVNEMIRRKHALWSAYAGWSAPVEPISDDHGAIANFTIGLASAVPFVMSLKMKALGFTACATEMMSEADAKAAAEGIDVTNPAYCAQSALMGGLYAYCLKAVSPKFFGASANGAAEEMALRTAFMKGVLSGCAKLDTLKVMSQRTASGAFMMAMQQGISAINEDLNLGGDAWRDASQRFTETFVSSIPDMLAFSAHGVLEGHARASGGWRKMFGAEGRANRSQNLREAVENAFAVKTAVNGDRGIEERRTATLLTQIGAMRRAWTEGGEKALARLGMKPEEITEAKDYFEAERRTLGAAEELDSLEEATNAESLEELGEDAPLAERNAAAERYRTEREGLAAAVDRLAESLLGKMKDEPGAVRDLASVRNVWAAGHGVGAGKGDGTDAGAAALERAGFSRGDAAALSAAFGAERRGMYSPAAAEALRGLYTRSTRGQVEATAALAAAFGGRVRTVEGRTYLDIPMPDGGTGTLAVETEDMSSRFYGRAGDSMGPEVEQASGGAVKAAEWEKMTDAKRREAVEKHHLAVEGDFSVIDPSDPTLSISAKDAERIVGKITLDPSADPGAAFHEAFHGFSRFCRETGFFDEADLKWLHETYGDARQGGEQFDEESGAEGFRRYAALRLAGAAEDAAASPWRKMFALVQRMRHLRERNAAVERIASNAEEALYDQLLAGRYAHIRDLKFTEPAAPKAETGGGTAAPQTGAKPMDESKGGGGEPVQPKPPEKAGGNGGADESLNGNGELVQPSRVVSFEALTPTGGRKVKGHYEIVPLAELLHSNKAGYPMELQQRDRKENKGEEATRENHVENFEAGYLLADPKTDSGAMVVARLPDADGKPHLVVVSGNGRTMVLEELASRHLYDRYRNRMKEWAAKNGVENAVADADNPVLVRVLDDLGGATLKEIADLSNTNAIQQMNEEETARADADLVRSLDLARLYVPNLDGSPNMAAGASDSFLSAFVRAIGDTSLQNSDGTFTEALRLRARRALLAIACGQGPRGRDTVKKLVEDTPGLERQKDMAAAIAPHVAAAEARPEYAIGPDVSRAFADYVEFRENRESGAKWGSLEEYLRQGDMLDQRSEIAESIMRLLDDPKGAPVLTETTRLYVEAAKGETDGLFGAARTRAEIWRDAAKAVDEKAVRERARSEGAFKPETRFSIRGEKESKRDEEKKTRPRPPTATASDQTPPAQVDGDSTSRTLTLESADPVKKFGDSISQSGVKSPSDFLVGLVHALGSNETNPDKTQYFDITHEDGKILSLRVANHRATARFYRERGNNADVKTSIVVKMSDRKFHSDRDVALTEHVYFSDRLTAEREAAIASGVAEWIRTGEWHGPAADQVNMSPRRRYSIGGIYTGSAADYDKPSLHYIGTGEGAQVYGWGLYGSTVRGVAEGYANPGGRISEVLVNGERHKAVGVYEVVASMLKKGDAKEFIKDTLGALDEMQYALDESGKSSTTYGIRTIDQKYIDKRRAEIKEAQRIINEGATLAKPGNVYEQTFFTDRAPGDESHLLKWYDEISDANWDRVIAQAEKEGLRDKLKGAWWLRFNGDLEHFITDNGNSSDAIYERLSKLLGTPQAASEFLARAGIDGVKYPVDSYGGKGVKNGDEVGWNYVSFRDDNIRVDHKWTDGQQRYSIAGNVAASNMGIKGAAEAEALEKAGKDREDIWRKTGWWRGKDGRWRFELPSVKMKGEKEVEAALREGINGLRDGSSETTLEKVLDAPALFEAYPRLKKTKIVFSPEHDDKTGGWYDAGKNEIVLLDTGIKDLRHRPKHEQNLYDTYQQVINSDEFLQKRFSNMDALGIKHGTAEEERALAKDWIAKFDKSLQDENAAMVRDLVKDRGQYSTFGKIVHEIQHAVQYLETFAKGGNPESADAFVKNMKRKQRIWAYKLEVEDMAKQLGTSDPYKIERAILSMLGVTSREQIAGLEAEGWIPDQEGRDKGYNLYARGYDKEGYEDAYNEYLGEIRKNDRAGWWEGTPHEIYRRLAGEVEARNASRREAMTPEERAEVPPWETEDVPSDRQIVRYSVSGQQGYDPRGNVPAVRGGWNEKKILRYLKANPSLHGVRTAARLISEFDTVDELKDHMFYHGTRNYVDKMQPSMTQSERWAQEHGGGGYGQRYWGISVSKSKKVASNFGTPSPGVSIYPVVLAKGAKVIDRPDLTDAADVEDHIVELWNDGVDAVRLGDWKSDHSEQELLVLNPRAICNIGTADSYRYFRLGSEENPLDIKDDAHIARMLEAAREYADYSPVKRFGKPVRPSLFYPSGTDGTIGEMKPREVIDAEKAQYEKDLAAWQESEQGIAAAEYEAGMRDAIRYSIVSLGDRKVAVLDRKDEIAKIDLNDRKSLHDYLVGKVGQELMDGFFVGDELPNEYIYSEDAKGNNKRKRKAKAKLATSLDEAAQSSAAPTAEDAEHKRREGGKYYRRAFAFAVPSGLDGAFRAYTADLVSYMKDGTERLYDVVNIEDAPGISADLAQLPSRIAQEGTSRIPAESGATSAPEGTAGNISNPADEIKRDPEAFARKSIVSRMEEGSEDEKESALVAFVAERALRHGPKPNAIKTIGRIGLELGLKVVDTGRIIKKGEALAERVRGTVIERAVKNGDAATAVALLARESDIDRAVDDVVSGAAEWGGKLTEAGKGRIKSILEREIEKTVRSFNAASLADVERDTGIDIAGEILANSPEKFDPKSAKPEERSTPVESAEEAGGSSSVGSTAGEENLSDWEIARRQRVRKEAEERVAKMIATAKERTEKAKKEREEWEKRREERKRKAEESAEAAEEGGAGDDGERGGENPDRPKLSTFADFKSPEEFAAFFRVWAEDRYKKEHGTSTLGKHEEKRLFPEFYRKAAVRELQDLADKLLPPKGARATVNRWLGEIQPGVRPDTLERISADVFAYINRNAIRESRTSQIQKFRNGLQEFVKGPQFDDLKMDADRKVPGWVEEAARYIRRVCNLSIQSINGEPSQLEKKRAELQAILDRREKVYDDEGKNAADAPKFDMETRRALAKLQLLDKYGAMKRYMPGEIADLADEAMRWLQDEAVKLEAAWKDAREAEDSIRGALAGGIVGPNGQKYKRGDGVGAWFDGLFDSLNGMIRLRLQHLVRFADSAHQQKAKDAINRVVVMLGDGEVAFARHLQDDRAAFHKALAQIFATSDGKGVDRRALADWLNRMTEAIPKELSAKLSKQGYADSMTYGQMLQLLVSLEQRSYAEAIKTNGRDGQAALIRTFETVGPDGRRERVLTDKDILFIDWLRSFYEAKRGVLSEVTKRMTGLPVDSPDPLYCPVKMYMGDQARGMHADSSQAWDPIGAVFSRRVETLRDFDESASILGQFFDRSAASANLVAWGERGSVIRGVFTSPSVQESIRRAFGGGELTKILRQLEETFNGGENIRKSPGEIAAADKAMNWMTYLSLGYNPLSAAKQTTSFTVWANALPGGFRDLWRYMTDVDMATIKHIKESEEYKVRYGNDVGSGHDVASKGIFENPSENPVAAFFRKTSMGLLRKGDFLPGGWIAQGLFRDLYNRHLKEGMDADAADRLAMTETFNMLEETQQSGRTYNTAALAREHGRLGRLLVQFATSPLQQLQYETQAMREVRDLMRYRPPTPDADYEKRLSDAKGKLVRAAVINHVLLPAALHAVTNLYRLAMGYDPEWEKEGWHWSLLRDVVMGQFSRVFFLGAISSVTTDVLITGKPVRDVPALIPAEGVVKLFGNIVVTPRDVATLDYERVQKDLDRLLKSTSVTRTPYDIGRLVTGKAYAEREERRKKRREQEAKKQKMNPQKRK